MPSPQKASFLLCVTWSVTRVCPLTLLIYKQFVIGPSEYLPPIFKVSWVAVPANLGLRVVFQASCLPWMDWSGCRGAAVHADIRSHPSGSSAIQPLVASEESWYRQFFNHYFILFCTIIVRENTACKNATVLFNRLKQVSSQAAVLANLTSKMLFSWT